MVLSRRLLAKRIASIISPTSPENESSLVEKVIYIEYFPVGSNSIFENESLGILVAMLPLAVESFFTSVTGDYSLLSDNSFRGLKSAW